MATATLALSDDIDVLKALVSSIRVELTAAKARASAVDALVTHLKQQIALLRRDKYGASAERSQRLADQLELRLEELEADGGEDEVVAKLTTPATDRVASFERKRPARKPFPAHLSRERIVVLAPCACPSCGGERLSKLGECSGVSVVSRSPFRRSVQRVDGGSLNGAVMSDETIEPAADVATTHTTGRMSGRIEIVADMLAGETWRKVAWRHGTKGRLTCLFAAKRVRIAEGHRHRMADNRVQSMPGDEVWLVGERRSSGERKYYVSNLPPDTPLRQLAAAIKARWVCEQAHQQLKEELGLDHFEG